MNETGHALTGMFKSYVSKPEITVLGGTFMVRPSQNTLIDYAQRVISRNGYQLFGAANTGAGGMEGSYEWNTSNGAKFPTRNYDGRYEFYFNSAWRLLKSGFAVSTMQYAKIWDTTELIDMLISVIGDTNFYKWSGGATTVASATATTVTKQGVMVNRTTIAFVAGTPGTIPAKITDSAAGFLTAGFTAGDLLNVTNSPSNSRRFTIASVTAGTITLIMKNSLTSEAAGATISLDTGEPNWYSSRFIKNGTRTFLYNGSEYSYSGGETTDTLTGVAGISGGTTIGTATISLASPAVISATAHGLAIGDPVRFTTSGALPTGISAGIVYYVITAGFGVNAFEISLTPAGSAVNTSGSQSGIHTLIKAAVFPAVTIGDPVWQALITIPLPAGILGVNAIFKPDLIGVQLNQLVLASSISQDVFGSKTTDYTNFTLTSPRAPGDPFHVTMDNFCTCIVPIDNQAQTTSSLMFGGGSNEFFQFSYQLSNDQSQELVRMVKLKTASGSGLISTDAITPIKLATAYISREPALDTLENIENADAADVPLSDPIKDDFDYYNFQSAQIKYWKRALYIAVPAQGLVLIYDLMRKLWQPPQTIPVSRLAIIDDWLYGHSAVTNESYRLFTGTNDNGSFIPQVARFGYENDGKRDVIKNLNRYWTDGYITPNGVLNMKLYLGFDGISGIKKMTISGSDTEIAIQKKAAHLGTKHLGAAPLGGGRGEKRVSIGATSPMLRFWQDDSADVVDYTERFIEYTMNTLNGQFAIVSHGANAWNAYTAPVTHTK